MPHGTPNVTLTVIARPALPRVARHNLPGHTMPRLFAYLLALLLVPLLSGCMETFKGGMTNRVVITVAQDSCATNSRWFGLAIGSDVDQRDCDVILMGMRLSATLEAVLSEMRAATKASAQRAPRVD